MPVFIYRATDPDGIEIAAKIDAPSARAAIAALKDDGLTVISVEDVDVLAVPESTISLVPARSEEDLVAGWTDLPEPSDDMRADLPGEGILAQKIQAMEELSAINAAPVVPARVRQAAVAEEEDAASLSTAHVARPHNPPRSMANVNATAWAPGSNGAMWFGLAVIALAIVGTIIGVSAIDSPALSDYLPLVIGGSAVLLIGVVAAGSGARRRNRIQRALGYGHAVEGRVVSITKNANLFDSERAVVRVRYAFTGPLGRVYGSVASAHHEVRELSKDDKVWVVFDPTDTRSSALWPPR